MKKLYNFFFVLFLITLVFLLLSIRTSAQSINYEQIIKEYLIEKKELEKDDYFSIQTGDTYLSDAVNGFAFELVKNNGYYDNICGIYRIGVFASHSFVYLFLLDKDKNEYFLLDTHNFFSTIEKIFDFLDNTSCEFSDYEKLAYIRKIIDIYNRNIKAIPWTFEKQ